jgi:adenosylcobinamide-GDP ribazoletransferase
MPGPWREDASPQPGRRGVSAAGRPASSGTASPALSALDRLPDSVRFALGTFMRIKVPAPRLLDRRSVGNGLVLAPVVGAAVGAASGLPVLLTGVDLSARLLSATLVVALAAWITRGLHWDGLADLADGLGSGAPPARARDIMARSDIGPFGVLVLVLVVLSQVFSLAQLPADRPAYAAWVVAVLSGRLAVVLACGPWARAARPGGLGATVAGAVAVPGIALAAGSALLLGVAIAAWAGLTWWFALLWAPMAAAGTAVAVTVLARRRLQGITGDVLGAIVELTTTVVLLGLVLR